MIPVACLIFAVLEPLGVSAPTRAVLRDGLIGFALIVAGVGDHPILTRLARARRDESHDVTAAPHSIRPSRSLETRRTGSRWRPHQERSRRPRSANSAALARSLSRGESCGPGGAPHKFGQDLRLVSV